MRRRESNDNWKQLLIKLERLGVKPWFIHLLVTRWSDKHVQEMRTFGYISGKSLSYLFYHTIRGACESKEEQKIFNHIYNNL